jgi:hypothetical protein
MRCSSSWDSFAGLIWVAILVIGGPALIYFI